VTPNGQDIPTCGNSTQYACRTISYGLRVLATLPPPADASTGHGSFLYVMSGVYDITSTVYVNITNVTIAGTP